MQIQKIRDRDLAFKLLDNMPKSIRDFFNYSIEGWHSSNIITVAKMYAKGMPEDEILSRLKQEEQFLKLKNFLK